MPPIEYKNRAVVRLAGQLLVDDPDLSIEEAASVCGFESSAYFRRVFRSVTGCSPRDYRRHELS